MYSFTVGDVFQSLRHVLEFGSSEEEEGVHFWMLNHPFCGMPEKKCANLVKKTEITYLW